MGMEQGEIVSKLCLGTVQFGQRYGIKNELGRQPTPEECFAILDEARARGIQYLDTASKYGTAEHVLGAYGLAKKDFRVCSKLRPDDTRRSAEDEKAFIVSEARASLARLAISRLYGFMLHQASDIHRSGVIEGLIEVKRLGLAEHVGSSVYEPEETVLLLDNPEMDIVQIPYNALDQRWDRWGFFEKVQVRRAEGHPFEVFARSVFLQGALLMNPDRLPIKLACAKVYLQRFQDIAARYGFRPFEAAMLYALTHSGIDHVVFGVDTEEQLAENLAVAAKAEAFANCAAELRGAFDDVPHEIVMPNLW